jgi:RNA polymerase sigma factor (sigma-70 family)
VATGLANSIAEYLHRVAMSRQGGGQSDAQLLECFIDRHDGAAFAALVARHGPMVLGVCRRIVGNPHDAEDAFQATFLVLAKKAADVSPRALVGNWLYGVAYRAAAKVRAANNRRQARERQVARMPDVAETPPDGVWRELRHLLDREMTRLPANYRAAVILCDLEGKTGKDAARQLGWPEGTLFSRLARGRELLARRLSRHGLTVTGAAVAALLARESATAGAPLPALASTAGAAADFAARTAVGGVTGTRAAEFAGRVTAGMSAMKLKAAAGVLLTMALAALACGTTAGGRPVGPDESAAAPAASSTPAAVPAQRPPVAAARDGPEPAGLPDTSDGFITRTGEYRLFGGKLVVKVWGEGGEVRWTGTFAATPTMGEKTLGPTDSRVRQDSPWFLYPASADAVWAYEPDARRMVLIRRYTPRQMIIKNVDMPSGWTYLLDEEGDVPAKMLGRLPPALRPPQRPGE